jgi:hypothetical protein
MRNLISNLVLMLGVRWTFAAIFDTLLLTPLVSATPWQSVTGDAMVLGHGSITLAAVVFARIDEYAGMITLWLLAIGALALGRVTLGSLVFASFDVQAPPWTLTSLRRASRLWVPFVLLAVVGCGLPLMGLVLAWLLLPTLGRLLLPWLGEQGTDLLELALLVIVLGLASVLHFLLALTRAELAFRVSSPRGAFQGAIRRARLAPFRLLRITLPRLIVAFAALLLAADVVFVGQTRSLPTWQVWLGVALAEMAATFASWCYLDWLRVLRGYVRPHPSR